MKTLAEYRQLLKTLGARTFAETHRAPVLVFAPSAIVLEPESGPREAEAHWYSTERVRRTTAPPPPSPASPGEELTVYAIEKRPGGVFQEQISIGRTRNNDIHLPYADISKYHAYFVPTQGGYALADAGSKNGTFVDERRLVPRTPEAVEDETVIRFGPYSVRYLSTDGFLRWLTATL
jgi:hypothetical protein